MLRFFYFRSLFSDNGDVKALAINIGTVCTSQECILLWRSQSIMLSLLWLPLLIIHADCLKLASFLFASQLPEVGRINTVRNCWVLSWVYESNVFF